MIASLQRLRALARGVSHALGRGEAPAAEVDRLRRERDAAVEAGRWPAALAAQQRLAGAAAAPDRAREAEWLAAIHYELGRAELARGNASAAAAQFRGSLRADRRFVPATMGLGEALEAAGDRREAVRTWERAVESEPALPVLARLERAYRDEGRPSRMIALYRAAAARVPDDLALAVELGRVYFDLEMLDEAADHFEKLEVRAPDLPLVHAYLGAIFEHRGETAAAFTEYRRALGLARSFALAHRCQACGVEATAWQDRCAGCGRWNSIRAAP